jgi:hypothetical protein
MLALARWRFPDVTFYHGDMVDFALGRQFDEKAPARPVLSSRGTGAPPARGLPFAENRRRMCTVYR